MATQTAVRLASWPMYLKEELSAIPEVVAAYTSLSGDAVRLSVFIDNYTDEIIDKVLTVEDRFSELYRDNSSLFLFDVLAMPASGTPDSVVPGAAKIYYAEAAA